MVSSVVLQIVFVLLCVICSTRQTYQVDSIMFEDTDESCKKYGLYFFQIGDDINFDFDLIVDDWAITEADDIYFIYDETKTLVDFFRFAAELINNQRSMFVMIETQKFYLPNLTFNTSHNGASIHHNIHITQSELMWSVNDVLQLNATKQTHYSYYDSPPYSQQVIQSLGITTIRATALCFVGTSLKNDEKWVPGNISNFKLDSILYGRKFPDGITSTNGYCTHMINGSSIEKTYLEIKRAPDNPETAYRGTGYILFDSCSFSTEYDIQFTSLNQISDTMEDFEYSIDFDECPSIYAGLFCIDDKSYDTYYSNNSDDLFGCDLNNNNIVSTHWWVNLSWPGVYTLVTDNIDRTKRGTKYSVYVQYPCNQETKLSLRHSTIYPFPTQSPTINTDEEDIESWKYTQWWAPFFIIFVLGACCAGVGFACGGKNKFFIVKIACAFIALLYSGLNALFMSDVLYGDQHPVGRGSLIIFCSMIVGIFSLVGISMQVAHQSSQSKPVLVYAIMILVYGAASDVIFDILQASAMIDGQEFKDSGTLVIVGSWIGTGDELVMLISICIGLFGGNLLEFFLALTGNIIGIVIGVQAYDGAFLYIVLVLQTMVLLFGLCTCCAQGKRLANAKE